MVSSILKTGAREALKVIRPGVEAVNRRLSLVGPGPFHDPAAFAWTLHFESEWRTIRRELDAVLQDRAAIPNYQDLSPRLATITQDNDWKTFFLWPPERHAENAHRCPVTTRLLATIPGVRRAMFSILGPGKHLPPHRAAYNGVLRYHLGLLIPGQDHACGIRVAGKVRRWTEGQSLIFDDTRMHEAWNNADEDRAVLFVTFLRPLPFPAASVNRVVETIVRGLLPE